VLSYEESLGFQRAIYRIMLMSFAYGMGSISDAEMADESYPYAMLDGYQLKQKRFLSGYTSVELQEIARVVRFLHDTSSWVMGATERGMNCRELCMYCDF
jgi:hypothetical protein